MLSKAAPSGSSSSLSSLGSSATTTTTTSRDTPDSSQRMTTPEIALSVDISANADGVEDSEALELAKDVVAMSQPDRSRWRWLAMAAPRETWRRDDEAKACENLATESCRVTFGLSLAGVSMPSLSLRVVADDGEMDGPTSRSSLESRHTVASSSGETVSSAHALSTPATSPVGHGHSHGYGHGSTHSFPHFENHVRPPRRAMTSDWSAGGEHTSLDTIDESDRSTFARRTRKQLVVNRRHHCRRCAGIFCERHSSRRATLLIERSAEAAAAVPVTPGAIDGITAWWRSLPPALSILTGVPRKATTVPASPISPTPSSLLEHRNRPLLERKGRSSTCGNVTAEVASASFVKNPHASRSDAATATVGEGPEVRPSSEPAVSGVKTRAPTISSDGKNEPQSLPDGKSTAASGHHRRRSSSLARLGELQQEGAAGALQPEASKPKPLNRGPTLTSASLRPALCSPSATAPVSRDTPDNQAPPGFIAFRARVCDQCWLLLERAKGGMELQPLRSGLTMMEDSYVGPSRAPSLASSTSSLRRDPSSTSLVGMGAPHSSGRGHRSTKSLLDTMDDEEREHLLSVRRVRDEKRREIRHFRRSLKQTVEARLRECANASGAPSRELSPDGRMSRARARRRRDEEQRAMDEVSHRMAAILAAGPRSVGDSEGSDSSDGESDEEEMVGPVGSEDVIHDASRRRSLAADDWRMPKRVDPPLSSGRMLTVADSSSVAHLANHRSSPLRNSPVSSPSPSRSRPGRRLGGGGGSASHEDGADSSPAKSPAPGPGLMGRERLRRAFEYQIKHGA